MTDYHQLSITEISQSVSLDKIDEMQHQADAWHGLAYLLDSQLSRLDATMGALATAWSGPAGEAFAAEVAKTKATLTQARDTAKSNAVSWGQVINEATSTRENIYRIEGKYREAVAKAQAKFTEDQDSWRNNPIFDALGLGNEPTAPNDAAIRAKYDRQARELLDHASNVYADQFHALREVPTYSGPIDTNQAQWGSDRSDGAGRGSGGADLLGGVGLTVAAAAGAGWTGTGPDLAGVGTTAPPRPTPTLPPGYPSPQVPTPSGPPVIGVPGGPFPPGRPGGPGPGRGPQVPTGRTPLLPEPVAERPTIGARPPREVPRPRPAIADESVIGSRRAPGVAGAERPAVRPSDGRPVIGRETPTAGRSGPRGRAGGIGDDGVVRSGRGSTATGAQGALRDRRDHWDDEDDQQTEPGEGTELWEVAEGVDPVVEPAEVYDPRRDRPGPAVGQTDGPHR